MDSDGFFGVFMIGALSLVADGFVASYLVNGLDDFMMDVSYYLGKGKEKQIKEKNINAAAPRETAILLPAWNESGVIGETVESFVKTFDFPVEKYDIFLGVYPNDLRTTNIAKELEKEYDNVVVSVNSKDGPTTKAQNLNGMYQDLERAEKENGKKYEVIALHDAEDDIHPDILKLYSYLIPENDMVQIPVVPYPPSDHGVFEGWISGVYCDEFSENHKRIIPARKNIGGFVPSAGTGTAVSRTALDDIGKTFGYVFNEGSLTEDYDLSMRLMELGKKSTFTKGYYAEDGKKLTMVCVRENFPDNFWGSVKQKARWTRGIALQTPEEHGWSGNTVAEKYTVARDFKGTAVNLLSLAGYAFLPLALLSEAPLIEQGSIWYDLMLVDFGLMANRLAIKASCVYDQYGAKQAALSIPRTIVGNVVNGAATIKSINDHVRSKVSGKQVKWDHTEHHRKPVAEDQKIYTEMIK